MMTTLDSGAPADADTAWQAALWRRVAAELRAGRVQINHPAWNTAAPFGGYKRSGNGREYGRWGIEEFQEVKAIIG